MFDVVIKVKIRQVEKAFDASFSTDKNIKLTKHLIRLVDKNVKDKYSNNAFIYKNGVSQEEIDQAIKYQKDNGDNFINLKGHFPLNLKDYDLDDCYAMKYSKNKDERPLPKGYVIKKAKLEELIPIEVATYGPLWGDDFTKRELIEAYNVVTYYGLYVNDELVSYCFIFKSHGYKMLDDLITKEDKRHKGYAKTLLLHLADKKTFLHADANDTPKDFYQKIGFVIKDRSYEYLKIFKK